MDDFIAELDQAAIDSRSEEKPEDTLGGKYAIARDAYDTATKYLKYFDGTTSVPSTVKDAVVFSEKVKTMAEYTKAESEKKAAKDAMALFTSDYGTKLKATKEEIISTITDPQLKEYNAQYQEANAAYS